MSPSATTLAPRRKRIISEVRLDELLTEVEKRAAIIKAAEEKRASIIAAVTKAADAIYDEEVGNSPEELLELQDELATFLVQRRTTLIRRFKFTIKRPMGVVKFVHNDPEMDWPKNETPVVEQIEKRPDGLDYLIVTKKLDKKAILKGPADLLAELRPHGVWKGRHLHVSFKTPSMKSTLTLAKRRINDRSVRTKKPE